MCPGYRLMDGELNQLRLPPNDVHRFKDYQMRQTFKMYSQSTRGIIKCPAEGCAWIAEAQNPEERIRVQCPMCHKEFCSLCNQQYHYRTQCQAIPALTQQWFLWCDKERGEYLTARDRQDAAYAKQMAIYTRHQETNKQQIRELATRYRELLADEKYKAANCRHCPQCRRVVEKLGGCEQMVCGQDADGGNNQSGCGHKFVWEKAPVYDAQIKTSSQPVLLKHPGRRARQAVGHQHRALDRNKGGSLNQPIIQESEELLHHKGAKCDACQEDIKGIKFDCIHCPALSFCEKCEQEQTLQHYNENNLKGQQQHVPTGKPPNKFAIYDQYDDRRYALKVIEETRKYWLKLANGETKVEQKICSIVNMTLNNNSTIQQKEAEQIVNENEQYKEAAAIDLTVHDLCYIADQKECITNDK
ncbi:unnamed protein product [Didymodactylos carnosus]|uniref:RBR-type E3 ubiquitin transferase n=1 Tax=Didymodactylos carnosus TaxID=1234261 RepID=A0A815CG75_9BILA|nr:unnamed protein product [Didymodactylos carnosus]CAF1284739.1 unnamed protein product [Didymodactylos carnosus]CAF3570631.1 unnamed protein product [Didymodactylos carnosus]CAF4083771.1 unnamed protein product [Didymodactylos carnosus]